MSEELLTTKELAFALKRSTTYIYAMKRIGFAMDGGRATISEARAFLRLNPKPRRGTPRNYTAQ